MTVSPRRQAEWLANFFGLPLTEQMKAAASVLEDASRRGLGLCSSDLIPWSPEKLRSIAKDWEAEDKKAEQVTELQQFIDLTFNRGAFAPAAKDLAKMLVDAGWTKNA